MPVVFQFQLFSTWGDPYYIGLNGLEFYDENGYRIRLTGNNITAYPHSVNELEGVSDDIRTPDKLIDGFNDTYDGRHMWLAPILPGIVIIYLFLSFFILFHFMSFHFISSHLIPSHLMSLHLVLFKLILSHFISSHFISFHFISSHVISFYFTGNLGKLGLVFKITRVLPGT